MVRITFAFGISRPLLISSGVLLTAAPRPLTSIHKPGSGSPYSCPHSSLSSAPAPCQCGEWPLPAPVYVKRGFSTTLSNWQKQTFCGLDYMWYDIRCNTFPRRENRITVCMLREGEGGRRTWLHMRTSLPLYCMSGQGGFCCSVLCMPVCLPSQNARGNSSNIPVLLHWMCPRS